MLARDLLRQYFGYEDFRPGQCEIIDDILAGRDVLGIMPTGAGKSMCFQIPALMMDGITIVISPLISLMKDQVNSLTQNGIAAAFINSSLTDSQMRRALDGCANGTYKLVYVAPERLFAGDFLAFAQNTNISMLTVDEAHCISQWGQDFRPSYTAIARFAGLLPRRPVVSAFTATATPIVRDDIAALLALQNPRLLISGFDRPNLHFEVRKPADKYAELLGFIGNKRELSGIIYCNSRALVEELCDKLILDGLMASRYHAGLPDSERRNNQDDFLFDRARIMVATNAFGMGIDKSNVSYVVHYNMPKDIEAYYQEAGRAGRDGHPADCLLMHGGRDMQTNLWFIEQSAHEHLDAETERLLKERNFRRLQDMAMYCETSECLRGYILRYFGESPPADCGNCANCRGDFEMANITIEAQKVLSCVVRMRERFGAGMVSAVLRGANSARIRELGLDKLATYGISNKSADELGSILNKLIFDGYLIKTADRLPILRLGKKAADILKGGEQIFMRTAIAKTKPSARISKSDTAPPPADTGLLAHLKALRTKIAQKQNLPAFVIFHDTALHDMCKKMPTTDAEFLEINGVGKTKATKYGKAFLDAIEEFKNHKTTDNTDKHG